MKTKVYHIYYIFYQKPQIIASFVLFSENRTRNSPCLNSDDLTFSGKVWYTDFK